METFTDKEQDDDDDEFKLDGHDNLDLEDDDDEKDDPGDYDDRNVGKKRKRVKFADPEGSLSHSKQTNERIKTEGGEAFILDESTSDLTHHQSSRVYGTFGRRKFGLYH